MRWSFEMGIGSEGDEKLFDFIIRLRKGFGIGDAANWEYQNLKLRERLSGFQVTTNYPKDRLFEIDLMMSSGRALIGRLPKSG